MREINVGWYYSCRPYSFYGIFYNFTHTHPGLFCVGSFATFEEAKAHALDRLRLDLYLCQDAVSRCEEFKKPPS